MLEPEREAFLVRVYESHWNEFSPVRLTERARHRGNEEEEVADLMHIADGALAQARIEERLIGR